MGSRVFQKQVDTYGDQGEHDLAHIEGMPPVVVRDVAVVLAYRQEPSDQCLFSNKIT